MSVIDNNSVGDKIRFCSDEDKEEYEKLKAEYLEKKEELSELIKNLAIDIKCDEDVEAAYEEKLHTSIIALNDIYSNGFMHAYADILRVLVALNPDEKDTLSQISEDIIGRLRNYANNYDTMPVRNGDFAVDVILEIREKIIKLFDHIMLELTRLGYFCKSDDMLQIYRNQSKQISNLIDEQRKNMTEQISNAVGLLHKANETITGLQTQMITILGVFAAIIVSFFGGMSFISSAITSIHSGTIFKSAIIVIIAGIVLVNAIFTLIYTISKIIDVNIYTKCRTEWCTCGMDNKNKRCNPIKRVAKRLPYIFYINLFLFVLLILVSILWHTNADSTLFSKLFDIFRR